ncbi:hypothetical protein BKP45_19045 [Anaerobacillus alkalidiazotrophicus]|uniref:Glycosyl transferase family 1 domain-containing protein n=1 Tax=Anaerobacillus alkalidiazotrophicus TaxID=472963 RepID=A0A1S2M1F1_9BACI|nr:glycosyltransferase family 4 protein [Anaerobacillus alkalidiazotrophicus]OIJ18541.1 hypothetical protein BKP45_19045 [Anaerobacillus alkalidiazotrophicus]
MVINERGQKKTIVFCAHKGEDDHITGAENYLLFLMKEMQKHNHCILISPIHSMLTSKVKKLAIQVLITPYPMSWQLWKPDETLTKQQKQLLSDPSQKQLVSIIKQKKADLVIVNTCVNPIPALAAKQLGVPVVWIISEVITKNLFTKQAVSFINQYSNWIIGVSYAVLKPFHQANLHQKTFVLYPTVELKQLQLPLMKRNREIFRHKLRLKNTDLLVGCIAAYFSPIKGFDHFIKVAVSLCIKHHHVHFLLIGKPTDKAFYRKCKRLIDQSRNKHKFHLLQFETNIYSVYPAVDIIVIPSLVDEGFSLVCQESLFSAKPVVAYQSGGLIEQFRITNNEHFIVEKGNVPVLENKVSQLITNPNLRQKVGEENRVAAMNNFGVDHFRQQLHFIFRKVFNN